MKVEEVKVAELNPAPYNPRVITEEAASALRASLRRFGLVEPIVWNRRTGNVVGGHQRLRALVEAGADTVPAVALELSDADERALNLTLNNPGAQGQWGPDLSAVVDSVRAALEEDFEELALDGLIPPLPIPRQFDGSVAFDVHICVCPTCGHQHHREGESNRAGRKK